LDVKIGVRRREKKIFLYQKIAIFAKYQHTSYMAKMKFLLSERIERAKEKEGRNQTWIIKQMNERGVKISDVQFSRKKKGHISFTDNELSILSEILNTDLIN
jgi:hypothetical protein